MQIAHTYKIRDKDQQVTENYKFKMKFLLILSQCQFFVILILYLKNTWFKIQF